MDSDRNQWKGALMAWVKCSHCQYNLRLSFLVKCLVFTKYIVFIMWYSGLYLSASFNTEKLLNKTWSGLSCYWVETCRLLFLLYACFSSGCDLIGIINWLISQESLDKTIEAPLISIADEDSVSILSHTSMLIHQAWKTTGL